MPSSFYLVLAYLMGSIPVGVLLARAKGGSDPRKVGSGNIGATNVMRAAGTVTGILTLLGDMLKGLIPVLVTLCAGQPRWIVAAAGLATFLGHLFPVFLKFRGGKGVATALGIFLSLDRFAIFIDIVLFIAVCLKWRYVSLASLVGVAAMPLLLHLLNAPAEYVCLSVVIGALIFLRHKDNIRRLIAGTENKMTRSADKG